MISNLCKTAKKRTCQNNIRRDMEVKDFWENRKNIEDTFRSTTDLIGWQYTDVLYSFLGIYVIGLYAFDKEKEENQRSFRRTDGGTKIFVGRKKQYLYSRKIISNYIDDNKIILNDLQELKDFLDVYCCIGNVIPIWPGGNESRGKFSCYDLPEFYFINDRVIAWKDYLSREYDNCLIDKIFEDKGDSFCFKDGLSNFLDNLSVDTYKKYLIHIKNIITERDSNLKKILMSKASYSSTK